MKIKSIILAGALMLSALGCAMPEPYYEEQPQAFAGHRFWFEPTNGRVGYHMIATRRMALYKGTTAASRGCYSGGVDTAGIPGAVCTKDLLVAGSLPPGLAFENCNSLAITGTPTQPGVWRVVIRMPEYYCQEGVTPPQDVEVMFSIEGTPVRGVR